MQPFISAMHAMRRYIFTPGYKHRTLVQPHEVSAYRDMSALRIFWYLLIDTNHIVQGNQRDTVPLVIMLHSGSATCVHRSNCSRHVLSGHTKVHISNLHNYHIICQVCVMLYYWS